MLTDLTDGSIDSDGCALLLCLDAKFIGMVIMYHHNLPERCTEQCCSSVRITLIYGRLEIRRIGDDRVMTTRMNSDLTMGAATNYYLTGGASCEYWDDADEEEYVCYPRRIKCFVRA